MREPVGPLSLRSPQDETADDRQDEHQGIADLDGGVDAVAPQEATLGEADVDGLELVGREARDGEMDFTVAHRSFSRRS